MHASLRPSLRPGRRHQTRNRSPSSLWPENRASVRPCRATAAPATTIPQRVRVTARCCLLNPLHAALLTGGPALQDAQRHSNGSKPSNGAAVRPAERPSTPEQPLPHEPESRQQLSLYYASGWLQPKLHCSIAGGPWHDLDLQPVRPELCTCSSCCRALADCNWLHRSPARPGTG